MFEAAVADCLPIFSLFRETLPAARLSAFGGVLNSTTTVVLEEIAAGRTFGEGVRRAQHLGVAETDPAHDVDGWDAAVKVCALANVLMGASLKLEDVCRRGIRDLKDEEVRAAHAAGRPFKLVARARLNEDGKVAATVRPERVAPEVAETGTQNHEGIAGAAAAVDFLASLAEGNTRRERLRAAFDALHARGSALTKKMWDSLSEVEGVKLYGPAPEATRTPTVAFTVSGVKSTDVARGLAERGVFVSHGDFYAATVVERLGLGVEGLVRAGCACYTNEEEVERLGAGVREIARAS
ncbi:MAG: hypothetical protein DMF66_15290 [Acidobacteria bacterium]|nr:MAG: hypothetical protein DMF66_15290 [Acidobacteriota bacterium]